MKILCSAICVVCLFASYTEGGEENYYCLIRFEDNGVCACRYGDELGVTNCLDDRTIEIQPCYCMAYDPHRNRTIVGFCYYSCLEPVHTKIKITSSVAFNADICDQYGDLHRTGLFCGRCNDSFGLAAYSYKLLGCVPCEDYGYKNWLKYFAVALLPLTVFYVLAVLLSFNVTSSSLNGIVLVIQCITSQIQMIFIQANPYTRQYATLIKAASSLLGMTNLDFFRMVYPPFCLHPKFNIPEILSLDYIIAVYPFLLIFITYVLVTAYDRNYRLLHFLCKPFRMCYHRSHKTWNIRASLIQLFATFILLSYVKMLGTSFAVLSLVLTSGKAVSFDGTWFYYARYDAATPYLGERHLPFAMLALLFSILAIIPLILLALYPCMCFQRCLNCCEGRCQPLHVFMDAFQGCYKTYPRDMRCFSAFYLLLRVIIQVQISLFPSSLMLYTSGILSLAGAAVVAMFQPYKISSHNKVDTILMLLMGTYFISYHANAVLSSLEQNITLHITAIFQGLSITLIILYFFLLLVWIALHLKIQAMVWTVKMQWRNLRSQQNYIDEGDFIDSFKRDEYSDSNAYEPLLRNNSQKITY